MKNNKILAAVLAACLCAPAFAQSDKTMESMGFSRIVRDPAAAAMGFAAKASDASPAWAAFGNPGLIPMTSTRFAAGVSYQSWAPKAVKTGNLAAGVAYHPGRVGLTVRGGLAQPFASDSFFLGDRQGSPPHFKFSVLHIAMFFFTSQMYDYPAESTNIPLSYCIGRCVREDGRG